MHRWFLSYNSQDLRMAKRLDAALKRKNPRLQSFLRRKDTARRRVLAP